MVKSQRTAPTHSRTHARTHTEPKSEFLSRNDAHVLVRNTRFECIRVTRTACECAKETPCIDGDSAIHTNRVETSNKPITSPYIRYIAFTQFASSTEIGMRYLCVPLSYSLCLCMCCCEIQTNRIGIQVQRT